MLPVSPTTVASFQVVFSWELLGLNEFLAAESMTVVLPCCEEQCSAATSPEPLPKMRLDRFHCRRPRGGVGDGDISKMDCASRSHRCQGPQRPLMLLGRRLRCRLQYSVAKQKGQNISGQTLFWGCRWNGETLFSEADIANCSVMIPPVPKLVEAGHGGFQILQGVHHHRADMVTQPRNIPTTQYSTSARRGSKSRIVPSASSDQPNEKRATKLLIKVNDGE